MKENNSNKRAKLKKQVKISIMKIRVIAIILALAFLGTVAIVFYFNNEHRIAELNRMECLENSERIARDWDAIIKARFEIIDHISKYYSTFLESEDDIKEELFSQLAEGSCFNYFEYIDSNGIDHAVNGNLVDVSDRNYFKDGMAGHIGMEAIYDSRATHDTMLAIYAPVYYNEKVIGVLVGDITTKGRIAELLDVSYYNNEAQLYLCDADGYIFAASSTDKDFVVNKKIHARDYFKEKSYQSYIEDTLTNGTKNSFISKRNSEDIGSVIKTTDMGWYIINLYPNKAHESVVHSSDVMSFRMILTALVLYLFLSVILVFPYVVDRREKKRQDAKQKKELTDLYERVSEKFSIVQALSRDMTDVCILNPSEGTSTALKGNGVYIEQDKQKKMLYSEMWRKFINGVVVEEDRAGVTIKSSLDNVVKELEDNEEYSFTFRIFTKTGPHYALAKYTRLSQIEDEILLGMYDIDDRTRTEVLENALEAAEQANHAKTVFLSNMSHDIRTPMNAIYGYTTLVKKHLDDRTKVEGFLDKIEFACNSLIKLINQVLEMSRIESGRVELNEQSVDLEKELNGIISVSESIAYTNGITFNSDISGIKDKNVLTDTSRFTQIMTNVLGNAMKYTEKGGSVTIKAYQGTGKIQGVDNYHFVIEDTGIGMSEKYLEHVFEEFSREKNSTTSGIQGTGLGMSIVKRLVDLFGGTIHIESEQGSGTKVSVTIPMKKYDATEANRSSDVDDSAANFDGLKVLLVDDNEMNVEIATEILEENGMKVTTSSDGKDAVDIIRNSNPGDFDIVLMDIQMPGMNGYDATRAIRALENKELANIPIVATTANAFEEDKRNALDAGMNAHIAKPIDVAKMKQIIADVVKRDKSVE